MQNRSTVITARCIPVRKVSELCPPCSDVMLTCAKKHGEAAVSDCAVELLSTDCADQKHDGK